MMKTLSYGAVIWDIVEGDKRLGGDSLNFASHLARLGADSYLFTRLGVDQNGIDAKHEIEELGVRTKYIQSDSGHPTGYARVVLDENHTPSYEFCPDASDEFMAVDDDILSQIKADDFNTFYFTSYCQYGGVSGESLYRILDNCDFQHVFCDINIRRDFYDRDMIEKSFQYADILKMNEEEAQNISAMLFDSRTEEELFVNRLQKMYGLKIVCITKGKDGCVVYDENGRSFVSPAYPAEVVDTVGAGDAFSAAFLKTLFDGGDIPSCAGNGNRLGGYVSSRQGAIPDYSDEVKAHFGIDAIKQAD